MKKLLIIILWIFILTCSLLLLWTQPLNWNLALILALIFLATSFIFGIVTLMKFEQLATIPVLLGGFTLSCLCALLEFNHFFLISMLYFLAFLLYLVFIIKHKKVKDTQQ